MANIVDLGVRPFTSQPSAKERLLAALLHQWRRTIALNQFIYNVRPGRAHACWDTPAQVEMLHNHPELMLFGCRGCGRTHLCRQLFEPPDDPTVRVAADPCPIIMPPGTGHHVCLFSGSIVDTGHLNAAEFASYDDWEERQGGDHVDMYDDDAGPGDWDHLAPSRHDSRWNLERAQFDADGRRREAAFNASRISASARGAVAQAVRIERWHREAMGAATAAPPPRKRRRLLPQIATRAPTRSALVGGIQRTAAERTAYESHAHALTATARASQMHGEFIDGASNLRALPAPRDIHYYAWFVLVQNFTIPSVPAPAALVNDAEPLPATVSYRHYEYTHAIGPDGTAMYPNWQQRRRGPGIGAASGELKSRRSAAVVAAYPRRCQRLQTRMRYALYQRPPPPHVMVPAAWVERVHALVARLLAWVQTTVPAPQRPAVASFSADEYTDVLARWARLVWLTRPHCDIRPIAVVGLYFLHYGVLAADDGAMPHLVDSFGYRLRLLPPDPFARALHAQSVVEAAYAGATLARNAAEMGTTVLRRPLSRAQLPVSRVGKKRARETAAVALGLAPATAATPTTTSDTSSDGGGSGGLENIAGTMRSIAFAPEERCTTAQIYQLREVFDRVIVEQWRGGWWYFHWFHHSSGQCWPRLPPADLPSSASSSSS